ncbi:MAG: tetratricopeptide repeat protein [Symploca sp. SIO3E6]|nr:tetratricopeptide repeat protein [Caldora sp. SIO3E6]
MLSGSGQTIGGRYKIISQLGQGGFGKTFIAQDQHLPEQQQCVVKQLKPQASDPSTLQIARRLFDTEAKVLYQLGIHEQIPRLFAFFEENKEFYLVQELIEGNDLSQELTSGKRLGEAQVISLLQDILEILEFVHEQKVIHRDINPHNIIRRKQDGKLVLIDFGAVKQVSTQVIQGGKTSFTVAIGTPGYRPSEQANGNPRLSSDIYAVGVIAIQSLTGLQPHQLPMNQETGEISWQDQAKVRPELARVLDKMVRYDFRERYQSAASCLQMLKDLSIVTSSNTLALPVTSPSQIATKPKITAQARRFRPVFKKILIAMGVIGMGVGATVLLLNVLKSANATDLYRRGETFFDLKRYEQALDAYQQAVEIKPGYAEAWQGQGNTLSQLQQYEEALEAYDQAIQIQPDYLEAWNSRGEALAQLQRYEEAIDAFDAALTIESDSLEAWQGRGDVQIKLQQYSAAIASFDQALELQPDYFQAWYRRGWALHNLRRYEEAVASYDQAVEYKPDSSGAWYQRGNALSNLQKYPEAVASYDQAVQFEPRFFSAWYSRGSALRNLRQYEEAVDSFDQTLKYQSDHYQAWYDRGWALHQLRRYEDAIASYDQGIKFHKNYPQAWYSRGNALYNLKNYQGAIASYNQAVALKPDYYEVWNSRGNALFNLKQYSQAVTSFEQALRYKSDYQEASKGKERALQAAKVVLEEENQEPGS